MREGATARLDVANDPIAQGEEGEIPAEAHVVAWVDPRPALAHEDVAGHNLLTTKDLHATSLTVAVATVSGTTLTFFMSHCFFPACVIGILRD
jgi:hypothetical protein